MEPLGITRACTRVPSIKRNARITQNHETTSCQIRSLAVSSFTLSSRTSSGKTASVSTSAFTMTLHFELHQFRKFETGDSSESHADESARGGRWQNGHRCVLAPRLLQALRWTYKQPPEFQ